MYVINSLVRAIYFFCLTEANQTLFFLDNEITGDVLLKLDVDLLKSEIGIIAFGKRTKIMNSIADLQSQAQVIFAHDNAGSKSTSFVC